MVPRVRSTIAAATVAVALLSACGSPAATQPAPAEPASAGRASLIGGPLSVTTTDGRGLRVPDGEHPTVLYFMAAWCVSCIQGARDLAQLHRDYGTRGLRVLAIDADQNESADDLARFRGLAGDPEYDSALDSGGRITQALGRAVQRR
jgi:thiol-disulfide isomerase/thioredoxin